ncbi:(2Fe-2S)-binding protein [Rhizobium leguminosarum]|uniref:(2Fe-2S)-binding protein n=1 Tax=Rhizobium leguminosarum TaxID=384 RepID=UPI001C97E7D7|nr:(2Fe-2S)-binding protein [Rhizobium leguminosarum]MBY5551934.1 (2Fe-2S)-binding protein [Rhizobium leguminosarum]
MTISFKVNGITHEVDPARGEDRLIDFLHDDLGLTGTKFCCGIGICRACTVASIRSPNETATPVVSCSTALATVDGTEITTIEGITPSKGLLPIQEAFLQEFSFQCGYCAPGFVMASQIFLDELRQFGRLPSDLDAAIEQAVGSHICRCTGYVRYYHAIRKTAEAMFVAGGSKDG